MKRNKVVDPISHPVNPWADPTSIPEEPVKVAARGRFGSKSKGVAVSSPSEAGVRPDAPWTEIPDRPSGMAKVRQIAFWGMAGLLTLGVLRANLSMPQNAAPPVAPPGPAAPAYPEGAARAVAEKAARAYLTWDEARSADRVRALSGLLAVGVDPQLGWDGRGAQTVGAVSAGAVTAASGGRARVRVDVEVTAPGAVRWIAVDVPVVDAGAGRLVVSGPPALLGVPESAAVAPEPATRATDLPFSAATRTAVGDFFKAWSVGGAAQAAAPGAVVPALPAGVELRAVQAWEAAAGTGADRWGTARVVWGIGGGEITQEYRVTLTRVESARAGRWQVAGIAGDDLS